MTELHAMGGQVQTVLKRPFIELLKILFESSLQLLLKSKNTDIVIKDHKDGGMRREEKLRKR